LNRSTAPGLLTLAVKFDIVSIRSLCDRLIIELIEDADLNEALKVRKPKQFLQSKDYYKTSGLNSLQKMD